MTDEKKAGATPKATGAGKELSSLRAAIDATDDRILDLLHERARLVRSVAAWNQEHGQPFDVPERERQVLARLLGKPPGPFPATGIRAVFAEIMSACLALERLRVAYLGPEGTFSHQAAQARFGLAARYVPTATIAGVFDEVEKGTVDLGVVPVENSSGGVVHRTLDEFLESELVIRQEIVLQVVLCLLSRSASLNEIQKVYSHPQPLLQCRRWLATNLPGAALVEVASTAVAAQLAKEDPRSAAVTSELAARLYDLPIVRAHIEDESTNVTRFLVIGPAGEHGEWATAPTPGLAADGRPADKTSIMFALRDRPGGLHRALAPFAAHGINLSSIESRPSRRRAWEYVFFIDLEGHAASEPVARALAEFREGCEVVKILGSYPRAEALTAAT